MEQMQRDGSIGMIIPEQDNGMLPTHHVHQPYSSNIASKPAKRAKSTVPLYCGQLAPFILPIFPVGIRLLIFGEFIRASPDGVTSALIKTLCLDDKLYQEAIRVFYSTKQCSSCPCATSQQRCKSLRLSIRQKVISLRV
ncbi:hypothetical protein BDZ45DRAFT_86423 [Acephala macrosclerotiorum]|nr:hypothetical protein BDZ45DRAFT_86423 [Acephala macrosclerotiorum]